MSDELICGWCKEKTTTDTTSAKWNVSPKGEKPVCFDCDYKLFEQDNYHLYPDYGPEEIEEDNERIRRNNEKYYSSENEEENKDNYYEVETMPTLGLSLSCGGKVKKYYGVK